MSIITTGVNATESTNRIRFESLSQRLQRINVDIFHKAPSISDVVTSKALPSSGDLGCYFLDELELCKKLETELHFQRFYWEIKELVQSLPELIHHRKKVVAILLDKLQNITAGSLISYFKLISVLARDLGADLEPDVHAFCKALTEVSNSVAYSGSDIKGSAVPNPELTAKLFECYSYILKSQTKSFTTDPESLRQYYGPLLGSSTTFVRDMAAKTFIVITRKLSLKTFKSHTKKIVYAVAANFKSLFKTSHRIDLLSLCDHIENSNELIEKYPLANCMSDKSDNVLAVEVEDLTYASMTSSQAKQIDDLFDGVAKLLFYTLKGVRGCLHSNGEARLGEMMSLLKVPSINSGVGSGGGDDDDGANAFDQDAYRTAALRLIVAGNIVSRTFAEVMRFVHPKNFLELWKALLFSTKACIAQLNSIISFYSGKNAIASTQQKQTASLAYISATFFAEMLFFSVSHSQGRGLKNKEVKGQIEVSLIEVGMDFCEVISTLQQKTATLNVSATDRAPQRLVVLSQVLFCRIWNQFSTASPLLKRIDNMVATMMKGADTSSVATILSVELFKSLSAKEVCSHLLKPLVGSLASTGQRLSAQYNNADTSNASGEVATASTTPGKKSKKKIATATAVSSSSSSSPQPHDQTGIWLTSTYELLIELNDHRNAVEGSLSGSGMEESRKKKREAMPYHENPFAAGAKHLPAAESDLHWEDEQAADDGNDEDDEEEDEDADSSSSDSDNNSSDNQQNGRGGKVKVSTLLGRHPFKVRKAQLEKQLQLGYGKQGKLRKKKAQKLLSQTAASGTAFRDQKFSDGNDSNQNEEKDEEEEEEEEEEDDKDKKIKGRSTSDSSKKYVSFCGAEFEAIAAACIRIVVSANINSRAMPLINSCSNDNELLKYACQEQNNACVALKCLLWFSNEAGIIFEKSLSLKSVFQSLISRVFASESHTLDGFALKSSLSSSSAAVEASRMMDIYQRLLRCSHMHQIVLASQNWHLHDSFGRIAEMTVVAQRAVQGWFASPDSLCVAWATNIVLKQFSAYYDSAVSNSGSGHNSGSRFILSIVLDSAEQDRLLSTLATQLSTPSHWLRLELLTMFRMVRPISLSTSSTATSSITSYNEKTKGTTAALAPRAAVMDSSARLYTKEADESESDIARMCWNATQLSTDFNTARDYARIMSSLEVLVRKEDRLPQVHCKILCSFALGLLHVKFKPAWAPAIALLVSAASHKTGEAVVWPQLLDAIQSTLKINPTVSTNIATEIAPINEHQSVLQQRLVTLVCSGADSGREIMSVTTAASHVFYYKPSIRLAASAGVVLSSNSSGASSAKLSREDQEEADAEEDAAQLVTIDSRVDTDTLHSLQWEILEKCPHITLRHSRTIVPIFVSFLVNQYFAVFTDDAEIPFLRRVGLFAEADSSSLSAYENENEEEKGGGGGGGAPTLPVRTLKKRLEMFLKVFAAVTSPKQLYKHQLLFCYYKELLSKPDVGVVRLAFDCIITYKPEALIPYKENIKKMLQDKTIRDELVNLDISSGAAHILPEHRWEAVPTMVHVLFGRFVSKSRGSKAARDQNLSRRVAVLTFLSKLEPTEMIHLFQLMVRGILPRNLLNDTAQRGFDKSMANATSAMASLSTPTALATSTIHTIALDSSSVYELSQQWCTQTLALCARYEQLDLENITWERMMGFLHLLEHVIHVVGHGFSTFVGQMQHVVLGLLFHAQNSRAKAAADIRLSENVDADGNIEDQKGDQDEENEDDEDDDEDDDELEGRREFSSAHKIYNQAARVRTLCLQRLAEMVHQYYAVFSFAKQADFMYSSIEPLIPALPASMAGSKKAPALLQLLHALTSYDTTVHFVAERPELVRAVIMCVGGAGKAEPEVVRKVMDILNILLDLDSGDSILPHAELIISSFSKRFLGAKYSEYDATTGGAATHKLSEMSVIVSGSIKLELKLLCRIAETIFGRTTAEMVNGTSVTNLATLLLAMLRSYCASRKIRVEEEWAINILRIYQSLLQRVDDVRPHVPFISRLFGPATHSQSLFNLATVRQQLVAVYEALSAHPSTQGIIDTSNKALVSLLSQDKSLIDSRDFGLVMPVFQGLSGEITQRSAGTSAAVTWASVLGPQVTWTDASSSTTTANATSDKKISKPNNKKKAEALEVASSSSSSNSNSRSGFITPREATLCLAVLCEVIRSMYDPELVIRGAALAALKSLVTESLQWSLADLSQLREQQQQQQRLAQQQPPHKKKRSASVTSLTTSVEISTEATTVDIAEDLGSQWYDIMLSTVMPAIIRGIKQSSDVIKRGFFLLMSHTVHCFGASPESKKLIPTRVHEALHCDLLPLWHEDGEQCFFENVSHIQLHRRIRAMEKLRSILTRKSRKAATASTASIAHEHAEEEDEEVQQSGSGSGSGSAVLLMGLAGFKNSAEAFSTSSYVNVLMPIAYHYLFSDEFQKKDHQSLMQEAASFIGVLSLQLPWNHYLASIKLMLKQLDKHREEKEKILLTALCAVLDSFHFDLSGSTPVEGLVMETLVRQRGKVDGEEDDDIVAAPMLEDSRYLKTKHAPNAPGSGKNKKAGKYTITTPAAASHNSRKGFKGDEDEDVDVEALEDAVGITRAVYEVEEGTNDDVNADDGSVAPPAGGAAGATTNPAVPYVAPTYNAEHIARVVVNSIVPWVRAFLLREVKDHKGKTSKVVHPHVALALTKLIRRLEAPLVPTKYRDHLFTSLVITVTTSMKSRDSSARDVARDSLAKMVTTLGMFSLSGVIYEMQHILKEGYQRHVCNYSIRHILTVVLEGYKPPTVQEAPPVDLNAIAEAASAVTEGGGIAVDLMEKVKPVKPEFDKALSQIADSVVDDLSGEAQEDRSVEGAIRSVIREAKGSKANDTLELCGRCLLFRPMYALLTTKNPAHVSSIHALSSPLLHQLSTSVAVGANGSAGVEGGSLTGRVGEALQRLALGLSKNPSVLGKELLLYIHATLQPFISTLVRESEKVKRARGLRSKQLQLMQQEQQQQKAKAAAKAAKQNKQNGGGTAAAASEPVAISMTAPGALGHILKEDDFDELDALDDAGLLPSYLRGEEDEEEDYYNNGGGSANMTGLDADVRFNSSGANGKGKARSAFASANKDDVTGYNPSTWLPSDRAALQQQRAVIAQRDKESRERYLVRDGASAPKLTGHNRHRRGKDKGSGGAGGSFDPAALAAVRFCLTLFHSCLKQNKLDGRDEEIKAMVVPFMPLLARCLNLPGASGIVVLAIKCLNALIGWGVTAEQPTFFRALSVRLLRLMFQGGGLVNSDTELAQACMKGLIALFNSYNGNMLLVERNKMTAEKQHKQQLNSKTHTALAAAQKEFDDAKALMPLGDENIRALLSLLTVSITNVTASFQNAAFKLVREIIDTRILVPEIYDLVTKLAEQIVLSQRKGIRDASSSIVATFMIQYPLGEKRLSSQLKQIINACKYEYADGRCSALLTLSLLVKRFPIPVLDDNASLIFLPTTLIMVNDKSPKCRETAAALLTQLCRRASADVVLQLAEYAMRWLASGLAAWNVAAATTTDGTYTAAGAAAAAANAAAHASSVHTLGRVGAQVGALLAKARPELLKKQAQGNNLPAQHEDQTYCSYLVDKARRMLFALLVQEEQKMFGSSSLFEMERAAATGNAALKSGAAAVASQRRRKLAVAAGESAQDTDDKMAVGMHHGGGSVSGSSSDGTSGESWVVVYHLVALLEQLLICAPAATDYCFTHPVLNEAMAPPQQQQQQLQDLSGGAAGRNGNGKKKSTHSEALSSTCSINVFDLLQEALLYPHAWVRSAACRTLQLYLQRRDAVRLGASLDSTGRAGTDALLSLNNLYQLGRRLCIVLSQPAVPASLLSSAVYCAAFVARAMHHNPQLCPIADKVKSSSMTTDGEGGKRSGRNNKRRRTSPANRDDDDDNDNDNDDDEEEDEEDSDAFSGDIDSQDDDDDDDEFEFANAALPDTVDDIDYQKLLAERLVKEEKEASALDKRQLRNEDDDDAAVATDDDEEEQEEQEEQDPSFSAINYQQQQREGEEENNNTAAASGDSSGSHGARWIVHRLRAIGADPRGNRRVHVMRVFNELVNRESASFIQQYMQPLLEVAVRVNMTAATAAAAASVNSGYAHPAALLALAGTGEEDAEAAKVASGLSASFLTVVEQKVGAAAFMSCYSAVQRDIQNSKAEKKRQLAAAAIADPQSYASRKLARTTRKLEAKARRNKKMAATKGKGVRTSKKAALYLVQEE